MIYCELEWKGNTPCRGLSDVGWTSLNPPKDAFGSLGLPPKGTWTPIASRPSGLLKLPISLLNGLASLLESLASDDIGIAMDRHNCRIILKESEEI